MYSLMIITMARLRSYCLYVNGKVLISGEGIKMGLSYGKFIGTILRNVYVITLGVDVGIELGSLDESFGGSNDGKI